MTDVKNGDASANSSDAVNGAQLYAPQKIIINQNDRINNLDNKVDGLNDRVNNLNDKMDDNFAKSAALNGLFQPYGVGKFNFTAVVGGYGSTNAVAVGSGYRINENVAVKTGVALSNENKALYNVGVNIEW